MLCLLYREGCVERVDTALLFKIGRDRRRPRPMAAMTATTEGISYIPSAPGTAPQSAANSCL
ncbi:MAG: hypothetical protein SPE93_06080 [Candidatus Limivicinus sp.]|nr:hypothetical protein [Candidatus Limivicinus sp.]